MASPYPKGPVYFQKAVTSKTRQEPRGQLTSGIIRLVPLARWARRWKRSLHTYSPPGLACEQPGVRTEG